MDGRKKAVELAKMRIIIEGLVSQATPMKLFVTWVRLERRDKS